MAQRRSLSSRQQQRPTHAATLVNGTVLHATSVVGLRVCGRGLGVRDQRRPLRGLGAVGREFGRRLRSVEGAVTRLSDACGRGSRDAKRAAKEQRASMRMALDPSCNLSRARDGHSPAAGG